ncbi:MAG: hypothetical protein HY718_17050 [Planctomycetes bacterium]|nr:hypothetical protein [Planctomycetota bacterium]
MTRYCTWLGSAILLLAWAGCGPVSRGGPLVVQPGVAQLFVDDAIIESDRGMIRTLHQPVKDHGGERPIIDAPPKTSLLAYGTIVFDTKLDRYVMFVQEFAPETRQMYQVLSRDGINWEPTDGRLLDPVSLDRNLGDVPRDKAINAAGSREIDLFSCYYDRTDATYPYKGWAWFANWGNDLEGIFYIRSRDGKAWERGRQIVNGFAGPGDASCRTIRQDGKLVRGPGDVTLFYHDPVSNRFLGIFKFFNHDGVGAGNNLRSRAYLWLDRLDEPVDTNRIMRIALLPPNAYRSGDTPFDEYYATTAWRYESLWLGTLKIFHPHGDYPHSAAGCAFFKLVVSRDGLNWNKVPYLNDGGVPEVFLPNGPEGGHGGRNDGGYMSDFSQGPLRIGDELIFYYSASSWGKNLPREQRLMGGGIFRGRLRLDGFVSVDKGNVTTRPLMCSGAKELMVNAVGPVKVEVLDAAGEALGSATLEGDSIRHAARFDGKSLAETAGGGNPRLRFTVEPGGKLYSFTLN